VNGEWAKNLAFAVVFFPCMGLVLFGTKEYRSFQPNKKDAEAGAKIVTFTNTETDNYALDNQKDTWYGNQWMPPPHAYVPLYEVRYNNCRGNPKFWYEGGRSIF
jgi:hypothetical protein